MRRHNTERTGVVKTLSRGRGEKREYDLIPIQEDMGGLAEDRGMPLGSTRRNDGCEGTHT